MRKLRRHMTILERRKLREEILARELQQAHRRADEAGLTMKCSMAMRLTGSRPEEARRLHASCTAEEPPNGTGCLCHHHDVITGSVETGTMIGTAVIAEGPPPGGMGVTFGPGPA